MACYTCPKPQLCLGGATCTTGRAGLVCSKCSDGYYTINGDLCEKCPESAIGQYLFIAGGLILILSILETALKESQSYEMEKNEKKEKKEDTSKPSKNVPGKQQLSKSKRRDRKTMNKKKSTKKVKRNASVDNLLKRYKVMSSSMITIAGRKLISTLSIITTHFITIGFVFPSLDLIHLPISLREWIATILNFIMLDLTSLVSSPECDLKFNPLQMYIMKMLLPLVFLCFFAVWVIINWLKYNVLRLLYPPFQHYYRRKSRNKTNRIIAVAFYLAAINIYILGFIATFSVFDCTEQEGLALSTLDMAPEYECNFQTNPDWVAMTVIGSICIVVYCILPAIGAVYYVFGFKGLKSGFKRPLWMDIDQCLFFNIGGDSLQCFECQHCDQRQRYGWLFEKYRRSVYFWELPLLLRKLALGMIEQFLNSNPTASLSSQILINLPFLGFTIYTQPYQTDKEIEKNFWNKHSGNTGFSIPWYEESYKSWSCKKCGTNNVLDTALLLAEILLTASGLGIYQLKQIVLRENVKANDAKANLLLNATILSRGNNFTNNNGTQLLFTNTQKSFQDVDPDLLYMRWPVANTLFAAFAWIGVVIFGIAMVIFFKDTFRVMIIYCFQTRRVDRERRKLEKQRSKEKFQARVDTTKVVPISHANSEKKRENIKRQFSRSRERSLTSQLFDANLEAVTTTKLIMRDEKRRASRRLERRKTLQSNRRNDGDGPNTKTATTKRGSRVKRERSLTTQLSFKSFAAEKVLKSRLTERRRLSLDRLQERIREKQQGKKGGNGAPNKKSGKADEEDFDFV